MHIDALALGLAQKLIDDGQTLQLHHSFRHGVVFYHARCVVHHFKDHWNWRSVEVSAKTLRAKACGVHSFIAIHRPNLRIIENQPIQKREGSGEKSESPVSC